MKLRLKERANQIITTVVATVLFILFLYPFVWMAFSSLKSTSELFTDPWGPPRRLYLDNFARAWQTAKLPTLFINSTFVSAISVAVIVLSSMLAAYAFSRMRFKGQMLLYLIVLYSMALPVQLLIVPLFIVVNSFGLVDTYWGVIFPYIAGGIPFTVFILKEFFDGLPRETEEAAMIDGASSLRIMLSIVFPLTLPAIEAVTIFQFLFVWNEFIIALAVLRSPAVYTIPVGLQAFYMQYTIDYPPMFAMLTLATLPVMALYVVFQRRFIRGITVGATKG